MKTSKTSAEKVLSVLNVLLKNFAVGFTNNQLSKLTGLSPSSITRYVAILEESGFAERIPETDRIRVSHQLAGYAAAILRSIDDAKQRLDESLYRITRGNE